MLIRQVVALVRRALTEVCTVPMLLVINSQSELQICLVGVLHSYILYSLLDHQAEPDHPELPCC